MNESIEYGELDDADDLPGLEAEDAGGGRSASGHLPVLAAQVVALLAPGAGAGESVVDCTVGRGGHAALLIPRIAGGTYLALDTDAGNAAYSREVLGPIAAEHRVTLHVLHRNFASLRGAMGEAGLTKADMLLADLGFASNQMDDPQRGFTFQADGPLDMRLDRGADTSRFAPQASLSGGVGSSASWGAGGVTAAELVNTLPEKELADLIYHYGEERLSRRIARKIVERRAVEPILTTGQLAELVRRAYPAPSFGNARGKGGKSSGKARSNFRGPGRGHNRGHRIHPATRTFMALRIAVNGELDVLDGLLRELPQVMAEDGRVGIISFHSLEDRPVKRAFLKLQQDGLAERLTRKPITADEEELTRNPRSRSAKLRGLRMQPRKPGAPALD